MVPAVTRETILEYVVKSETIKRSIKNLCPHHLLYEFEQFFYGEMCEVKENLLIQAYETGKLDYLCVRVMLNQIRSTTSRFYKAYRKDDLKNLTEINQTGVSNPNGSGGQESDLGNFNVNLLDFIVDEREAYDIELDQKHEQRLLLVDRISGRFQWYEKLLWDKFYKEGMSYAQIARDTDINYNSIYYTIAKCKQKIREAEHKPVKQPEPSFKKFINKTRQ